MSPFPGNSQRAANKQKIVASHSSSSCRQYFHVRVVQYGQAHGGQAYLMERQGHARVIRGHLLAAIPTEDGHIALIEPTDRFRCEPGPHEWVPNALGELAGGQSDPTNTASPGSTVHERTFRRLRGPLA